MSLTLRQGDYVPDGKGGFQTASETEELLEQAMFLLAAHRGGFPLLPEMGSRLYTLCRERKSARQELALIYAQEALEPLGLQVTGGTLEDGDPMELTLEMRYEGRDIHLEVTVD